MSRTTVKAIDFTNKQTRDLAEYHNSWGSAPFVWSVLSDTYLLDGPSGWIRNSQKVWDLYKNRSIPEGIRAVLMMTFDHAYVSRQDRMRAAKDIDLFVRATRTDDNADWANHWPAIANVFRELPDDIQAVGFHHTSTVEDPWLGDWDDETNTYVMDWSRPWDVYAELFKACN